MTVLKQSAQATLDPALAGPDIGPDQPPPVPGTDIAIRAAGEDLAQQITSEAAGIGTVALGETAPPGRFAQIRGTVQEIAKSHEVRAGVLGIARFAGNLAVSALDLVPGIGDLVSWAADAAKFTGRSPINLTPDVPKWAAIGSEFLEPLTGGFAPSHLVETGWQLYHDWPRIKTGFLTAIAIARRNRTSPAQA